MKTLLYVCFLFQIVSHMLMPHAVASSQAKVIIRSKLEGLGVRGETLERGVGASMRFELVKIFRHSFGYRGHLLTHTPIMSGEHYHKNGEFLGDLMTPADVAKRVSELGVQKGDRGNVMLRSGHLLLEHTFRFWGDTVRITKLPATDLENEREVVVSNLKKYFAMTNIYDRDAAREPRRSHLFQRWMAANMIGIDELERYANNRATYRAIIRSRLDELDLTKSGLHASFGSSSYDLSYSPPLPTYHDDLVLLSSILALDPALLAEVIAVEYFLRRYEHITRRAYDNTTMEVPLNDLPPELSIALQSALATMHAVNADDTRHVVLDTLNIGGEQRFTDVFPVSQALKDFWHKSKNK